MRRPDVGLVIANERYSGIDVVLGCFPGGGDSIASYPGLSVFFNVEIRRSIDRSSYASVGPYLVNKSVDLATLILLKYRVE